MGFTKPSKIQAEALPIILGEGRPNFVGQAHGGSVKTATYSLAMLSIVDEKKKISVKQFASVQLANLLFRLPK